MIPIRRVNGRVVVAVSIFGGGVSKISPEVANEIARIRVACDCHWSVWR